MRIRAFDCKVAAGSKKNTWHRIRLAKFPDQFVHSQTPHRRIQRARIHREQSQELQVQGSLADACIVHIRM